MFVNKLYCIRGAYRVPRRQLVLAERLSRCVGRNRRGAVIGNYAAEVIRNSKLDPRFLALVLNVGVQAVYSIREGRRRVGGRRPRIQLLDDAFIVLALQALEADRIRLNAERKSGRA